MECFVPKKFHIAKQGVLKYKIHTLIWAVRLRLNECIPLTVSTVFSSIVFAKVRRFCSPSFPFVLKVA